DSRIDNDRRHAMSRVKKTSTITKRRLLVTQEIVVSIDTAKFTEEFMAEFRESFYPFNTVDDHMEHIAQLAARGIWNGEFVEGYGKPSKLGVYVSSDDVETEVDFCIGEEP